MKWHIFWSDLIGWLERNQGTCFYKRYFGIECPGCGMQRSFVELLKGNVLESIILYPALLPIMLMLFYLSAHLFFKFPKGYLVLKISFIFTAVIILIHFILKQVYYARC